jgi:hypothetical protein
VRVIANVTAELDQKAALAERLEKANAKLKGHIEVGRCLVLNTWIPSGTSSCWFPMHLPQGLERDLVEEKQARQEVLTQIAASPDNTRVLVVGLGLGLLVLTVLYMALLPYQRGEGVVGRTQ